MVLFLNPYGGLLRLAPELEAAIETIVSVTTTVTGELATLCELEVPKATEITDPVGILVNHS